MELTKKKMTLCLDYVYYTIIPICLITIFSIFKNIAFNLVFVYDYNIGLTKSIFLKDNLQNQF